MRLNSRLFSSVTTKTFFVGAVVVLAVGAFAVTGVGSLRQLDGNTAGSVGSQQIPMRQLQEVLQNISRQNQADTPEQQNENVRQALNQLIEQKVFVEEGVRLGFEANDVEVATWVKKIPAFQNKDTKKFDEAQFEKFMKSGQMTTLELYRQGRDSVTVDKYYQLLSLAEPFPQKLKEETEKRNQQEFFIETVSLEIPESALRQKVKAEAESFAKDEKNLEELKKAYESEKAEFSKPAQVELLGLLVGHKDANRAQGDALKRTKEEAKALADSLLAKLKGGGDFASLAGSQNDDPVSKSNKGKLGFVDKTTIDKVTATAAFALNAGQPLSEVLETPFGYRIVRFVSKKDAVEKSFDSVKLELAERKVTQTARAGLETGLQTRASEVLTKKDAAALNAFVTAEGLAWKKHTKPVGANSRFIEELGSAEPLLKDLFSLKAPGDTLPQAVDLSGKKHIVRLVSRSANAPKAEEAKQQDLMAKAEGFRAVQNFVSKSQKKLVEIYRNQKEIKENPILFARAN